jgi:phosphotransferase system enzyme I (PtsI)
MKKLTGIPSSPGIAIEKALLYLEDDFPEIPRYSIQKHQVESEWKRFLRANQIAVEEIRALHEQALGEVSKEQAAIFQSHLMMLEDMDFQEHIKDSLKASLQNIEWVFWDISHEMSQRLMAASDPQFRERAVDISDIARRVMGHLLSVKRFSLSDIKTDVILVSHDLLPSDVLAMNKQRVKAIVMDAGGKTSHTAILARAFDIPAVLGLSTITKEIEQGATLVVNGTSGEVIINADFPVLRHYKKVRDQYHKRVEAFVDLRELPAETKDGYRVFLKANIGIPEEADQVSRYGAEGIGLYRSEFLFLTSKQATAEEEQYRAYSYVLRVMKGRPVTIRTLDSGGDKLLPNFQVTDEKNPLLGWRAIRFSLSLPELFKTQLRALLRASINGNLKIMFPMISGIEELELALSIFEEAKAECRSKNQAYSDAMEVGIMIEVPAAAMTADILAGQSAFFSIGTNDLVQYTLAVDRGNERVNYLAQPAHPAMIRSLKNIIQKAHEKGITVAMCGELAADLSATALLLGLGLDEFSMTAQAIPQIKRIIRGVRLENCQTLAEKALQCTSYNHVTRLMETWMAEYVPDVYAIQS